MIISPPFLPPRNANTPDAAYLDTAMPELPSGLFPVSNKLSWHGGIHLTAPSRGNGREPVCAIADGTVVYVRQPTQRPADDSARDAHPLGYNIWTDDGCIVIRHDTEIGANAQDQGIAIRFFSVYMHLNSVRSAIQANQAVKRKAELGNAGMFEGVANCLHFELICDDSNLTRMIGRSSGDLSIETDGRTDVVLGELYFHLPEGTHVYAERPALIQTAGQNGIAISEELFVGIKYEHGNAQLTSYRGNATTLPTIPAEVDAEYSLYATAARIVEAYRTAQATVIPAHSAVYELLRFGRTLGPDVLAPADVPHWRRIATPDGPRWANLNAEGIIKFSDGDAPHWAGWHLIEETKDGDTRCDVKILRQLLDRNGDGITTLAEAEGRLHQPAIKAFMRRVICKFPSEWHRASVASRWSWLTREGPDGPAQSNSLSNATYLTARTFPDFQRYAEALCFFEEANTEMPAEHWHFNPREFISLYMHSGWLSDAEFKQIYSEDRTPKAIRDTYRIAFNRVTRKYMYAQTAVRLAHFLGQGAIESGWMRIMQEKSMLGRLEDGNMYGTRINPISATLESTLGHWYGSIPAEDDAWFRSKKYNSKGALIASSYNWRNGNLGDPHAQKYRGRGFKQLTGLTNYSLYWVYRGWLNPSTFDEQWQNDPQYAAQNASGMTRRPPIVDDPHRATETPFNCIDTGGWYLIGQRPRVMRAIDNDSPKIAATTAEIASERTLSRAVTHAINGGYIAYEARLSETRVAKEVLL